MDNSKTVLITGCSSGIGHCVAHGLHKRGYQVIATARSETDVARLRQEGLTALKLDLNDSDSIKDAVKKTLEIGKGHLFALFNNGAYGQSGAVEDLSRDVLRAQFETNLFGTLELTNLLLPTMRAQGYGRIIQNSSVLGFAALPFRGAYIASKYALEGLTDTLRMELAGSGIFVALIEPGPIKSRFRANSHAMFVKNIDPEGSHFESRYRTIVSRLTKQGPVVPFTLPPEAVLKKLVHALESKQPKLRYYVTFPTYLFATLKWLLTDKAFERILLKISNSENE